MSDIDMDSTIANGKTWRKFFVSRYKNEKESVFYEEPVEGFRLVNALTLSFTGPEKLPQTQITIKIIACFQMGLLTFL